MARLALPLMVVSLAACSKNSEPEISAGELIFTGTCKVCHASGINGAPIFGNRKMWQPRLEQGVDTLISHAINGYGLMPAKGGNLDLTNEEVGQAVNYMVQNVQ